MLDFSLHARFRECFDGKLQIPGFNWQYSHCHCDSFALFSLCQIFPISASNFLNTSSFCLDMTEGVLELAFAS